MSTRPDSPSIPSTKICKTCCVHPLPAFSNLKNCLECRSRRNSKRRERTKLQRQSLLVNMKNLDDSDDDNRDERVYPTSSNSGSAKENASCRIDVPSALFPPLTKKPLGSLINGDVPTLDGDSNIVEMRLLHELEGKEKTAALKEIKIMLKGKVAASEAHTLVGNDTIDHSAEFQTASALYIKLKNKSTRIALAASSSSSSHNIVLNFRGWHSIIAVNSISNEQRVDLVVKELKKIARIIFSDPSTTTSTINRASRSFACHCLGSKTSASQATSSKSGPQEQVGKCKGRVNIVVENDLSHTKGLKGQRIEVEISH